MKTHFTKLHFLDGWTDRGINTHHVKKFFVPEINDYVYVDKTLNGIGGFFNVWKFSTNGLKIPVTIKINGAEYFGDGWTWKKAISFISQNINK